MFGAWLHSTLFLLNQATTTSSHYQAQGLERPMASLCSPGTRGRAATAEAPQGCSEDSWTQQRGGGGASVRPHKDKATPNKLLEVSLKLKGIKCLQWAYIN